jgi:hypothetical protein
VSVEIKYTQLAAYLNLVFEDHLLSPQGETFTGSEGIYYSLPNARYFHIIPNCSGMKHAQVYELSEFNKRGSFACPVCLSIPVVPVERVMAFSLLDADGIEIATSNYSSSQVNIARNGVRIYHQISMFQTDDTLLEKIYLQPMIGSEPVNAEPIECIALK